MKPKEKKALLVELIELTSKWGYDITPYVGKPLSHFDYDRVRERINWFKREFELEEI